MRCRRAAGALLVVGLAVGGCSMPPPPPQPTTTELDIQQVLGGDAAGFARALEPRAFVFPADHGPHPAFRNEWWYLTGNLEATDGRRFGYQFTLFRAALTPRPPPARASAWATDTIFMAHLALADARRGSFTPRERFARGALGLAGARAQPFAVWLEDWRLEGVAEEAALPASGLPPLRLRAADPAFALDLALRPEVAPVLHGDAGLSAKGGAPGSASYYYSFTRVATEGTVRSGDRTFTVVGESWLDREWSSAALEPGLQGWDWFSLQLSDDSELMIYLLRRADGTLDPASAGSWVDPAGRVRGLSASELQVRTLGSWSSPRGGRYPGRWGLRIEPLDLELEVEPILPNQEMTLSFRYWEGAVDAVGTRAGAPVTGRGFVELTGYAAGGDETPRQR